MKIRIIIIIYTIFLIGCSDYTDDIIINENPTQTKIEKNVIYMKNFEIYEMFNFQLKGRVLHTKEYNDDLEISNIDLALGWNEMSNMKNINKIRIWQTRRWYKWKVDKLFIPRKKIETNSANMHMIPINEKIKEQLEDIDEYDIIEIEGSLVTVKGKKRDWKSSTTRNDTGAGACEIILVKNVRIINKA